MGRKHCGKRRNCSLRPISPFPTVFSKDLYWKHVKSRACLGKGYKKSVVLLYAYTQMIGNASCVKEVIITITIHVHVYNTLATLGLDSYDIA